MKERKAALAVVALVMLLCFAAVLDASIIGAVPPSTKAAAPESTVGRYQATVTRGIPSPPVMWTANFSEFSIPVPENPDQDQTFYLVDWGDGTNTGWIGPYDPGVTVTISHEWSAYGTYEVMNTAKNQDGMSDTTFYLLHLSADTRFFFVFLGYVGMPYLLTLQMEENIFYLFDWGDGNLSDWLGPVDTMIAQHTWDTNGIYEMRWKAKDINGTETPWSDPFMITIAIPGVHPPTIEGPSWGIVNVPYTFTVDTTNDWLYWLINWGDGNTTNWLGPFVPGVYNLTHTWAQRGTYSIRMKFKGIFGEESGWVVHDIMIFGLKLALIVGRFTNMSVGDGYVIIHAVNLRVVTFLPPGFQHYHAGENVTFFTNFKTMVFNPEFILRFVRLVS